MGTKQKRIAQTNKNRAWRKPNMEARSQFVNELHQARVVAQKDAEAFDQLLFVFERFGCFLLHEPASLGYYRECLLDLAAESPLGKSMDGSRATWYSSKEVLYDIVNEGRNDALHQGARARHLTEHAIEFALILEDALIYGSKPMPTLGDIMVRNPVTAELWQPVSFVRQIMLTSSFSCLPVDWEGKWRVVTDAGVAAFLRKGSPKNEERGRRLGLTLEEAHAEDLKFEEVPIHPPDKSIDKVVEGGLDKPLLVCEGGSVPQKSPRRRLVGIITAFDVL
jgi:CBS domain-containing protein